MIKNPIPILSIDTTFTFGGAFNSLCILYRKLDKNVFSSIVISGHNIEHLESLLPGCTCYQIKPDTSWSDKKLYLKMRSVFPFYIKYIRKCMTLARYLLYILFNKFPEAFTYCKIARRHKIQLLHFNNVFQISGLIISKVLKIPCISHQRMFLDHNYINKFLASFVDHHVAISSAVRDNILSLGVPKSRISVVHNAINFDDFNTTINNNYLFKEFGLAFEQPTYGIFGRVVDWKGIREFVLAASEIHREIPEAVGFIVGDSSDSNKKFFHDMRQLSASLGLENNLIFTGYREDIPAFMSLMQVIVHASIKPEPFGRTIIEGMAMSKPIVATAAGGPLDIVDDGYNGYLVEMGNIDALGQSIKRLLLDSRLRFMMGKNGRMKAEEYFNDTIHALKMEDIFLNVLKENK